jgi:RNA polymerase sigma-70 factor (ECF subfamily)
MIGAEFQQVLIAARRGDQQAFATIWRSCNPALVRIAQSLGGRGDAEDVAAAVWVDVVRSLDAFVGDEDRFRAWLYTIARRRLIDLRRQGARRPVTTIDGADRAGVGDDPADVVDVAAGTDAALALIGSLPPDQAEAVLLRVVAGLDVAGVAEVMGRSPGAVRVLAHRGLRRLAVQLADGTDGSGGPAEV